MNYEQLLGTVLLLGGVASILADCDRLRGKTWDRLTSFDWRLLAVNVGCVVGGVSLLLAGRQ